MVEILQKEKDFCQISVIIPTYNRASLLKECLLSLNRQTYPVNAFDVIIVDDGSTDSTSQLVEQMTAKKLKYKLTFLRKENGGPAKARNLGIQNASGDLIAFTDDDCIVDEYWLEYLSKAFIQIDIAGVGGKVLAKERGLFSEYLEFKRILEPRQSEGKIDFLITANACYRKDVLIAVGGFEEKIKNPGGEDPDLSFKVTQEKGYRLVFEPKAIVYHQFKESFDSFLRMSYNYGRGGKFLYQKWGKKFCEPYRTEILTYHAVAGLKYILLNFAHFLLEWFGHLSYIRGYKKGY